LYQNKINYIKEKMPHACIGVDVIVGFPGESEEEFLKTYTFLQDLPISYLHVFTYSERENTGALKLLDEVIPVEIRKKRNKMLQILSQKKNRLFYESHLNTTRPVLFESGSSEEGKITGFTDNYISVEMPFEKEWVGKIIPLQLEKIGVDGKITGVIEQTEKHLHEA
jgi:threonylcarbamoyladenosine tRNA methylthiotransferase MtaB